MSLEKRYVSLGSRQSPCNVDRYLEQHFLYRKHTIPDANSLFRVVAEQLYDTQMLHYEVRKECVRFIFRKRRHFERYIEGDFDDYLMRMERTRTCGTMLELHALCHLYRRNAIIYKPFKLGKPIILNKEYKGNFSVFHGRNNHFNSVFTMSEISVAAICQAIAFKLLYKMVFRLPDIDFAVEMMLYPQTFSSGNEVQLNARGKTIHLMVSNGRSFKLDRAENTRCIMSNYQKCSFHNRKLERPQGNFMPKSISCVRGLLYEDDFPFPFAVAKSLDPYIYRNVELQVLAAGMRKAKHQNTYIGDYNFVVGARCHVALNSNDPRDLTICHIQDISDDKSYCVIYSEKMAQMLCVSYDLLHPLPPDQFRPWGRLSSQRRQLNRPISRDPHERQLPEQANHSNPEAGMSVNNQSQQFGMAALPAQEHQVQLECIPKPFPLPPLQGNNYNPLPEQNNLQVGSYNPQIRFYPGPLPRFAPSGWIPDRQALLPAPYYPPPYSPPYPPQSLMIRPPVPMMFSPSQGMGPPPEMLPMPYRFINNPMPMHNEAGNNMPHP